MISKTQYNKNILLVVTAITVFIIGLSPHLTETIYATGLYPIVSIIQRWISSLFPFAIGDFLYIVLVAILIWRGVKYFKRNSIKTIKTKRLIFSFLNIILLFYVAFKLLWALNYSRPPIAKRLNIGDTKYNTAQLVTLGKFFLIKLTELKLQIDSANSRPKKYSLATLSAPAIASYITQSKLNKVFNYPQPSVKAVIFANYITKSGIEGYYNPVSGEANVNMNLPTFVLPFTICHEIAHQTGIAKEDEANLLGYITAIKSNDINFQYSGYYCMFRSILWEIRMKSPQDYQMIFDRIPPTVLKDFKAENEFWLGNNSQMSEYMNIAFDRLLKLNNQKKGIKSYQDIVLWLYNYNQKNLEKALNKGTSENWITNYKPQTRN